MNTGLTEQEKESLIKYLCTKGKLMLKENGEKIFKFDSDEITIPPDWEFYSLDGPARLLEKAINNIRHQVLGIE